MFQYYNPNPMGKEKNDCVIRAICRVTGMTWDEVFLGLVVISFAVKEMPSDNTLWREYLRGLGFVRHAIPDTCPDCYTVRDFAAEHPHGSYILTTGSHLIAVVDGDWYDIFDSGNKIPITYWRYSR